MRVWSLYGVHHKNYDDHLRRRRRRCCRRRRLHDIGVALNAVVKANVHRVFNFTKWSFYF